MRSTYSELKREKLGETFARGNHEGSAMKSEARASITTPTVSESSRPLYENPATARRPRWRALSAILLTGVALCIVASLAVPAVGHPVLLQYGVALLIIGLLGTWIRSNRSALSADTPETNSGLERPFSVIHVALSPETAGSGHRALAEPPDPAHWTAAVRPAASATKR